MHGTLFVVCFAALRHTRHRYCSISIRLHQPQLQSMRRVATAAPAHCSTACPVRTVTTRGQFNPVHTFEASMQRNETAKTIEEFKVLVNNPGPLRIGFSADYLDWYFRAYREKCDYAAKKQRAAQKLGQNALAVGAPELGVPAGMFLRPPASAARRLGDEGKAAALKKIEQSTVEHGLMDCFERQPQFPIIHIDRCSDFHVRELVNELIVDHALSVDAIWEKALAYRALLLERKAAYPASFSYIFEAVDNVVMSKKVEDPQHPLNGQWEHADTFPTEEAFQYFAQSVKRYHVENALDVHVLLSCHRLPESDNLLFTEPPPKDLKVPLVARPTTYPSLKALMEHDGNLALLRVLLFADLNTFVSHDPFTKFPNAASAILRPKFEHASVAGLSQGAVSQLVEGRRGERYAPLSSSTRNILDSRGNDVVRMQRSHATSDLHFVDKELGKAAEADPSGYVMNGNAYLNPKTVRAEIRDLVTRKVLRGMAEYERAKSKLFRHSIDDSRSVASQHVAEDQRLPMTAPTIPKFLALILNDPVVHCLTSMSSDANFQKELRKASRHLARQMFVLSIEYHIEKNRRVNRQKQLVAAAVLDDLVIAEVRRTLEGADEGLALTLRRAGEYVPFAKRNLNEAGFPSEARFDDYVRWMRPPQP